MAVESGSCDTLKIINLYDNKAEERLGSSFLYHCILILYFACKRYSDHANKSSQLAQLLGDTRYSP